MRVIHAKRLIPLLMITAMAVTGCPERRVTVSGAHGQELTVISPRDATVERGSRETITVEVRRQGFHTPVTVSLSELPVGIQADRMSLSTGTNMATFVIRADETAPLVTGHAVRVTAEAEGMRAHTHFTLDVKE